MHKPNATSAQMYSPSLQLMLEALYALGGRANATAIRKWSGQRLQQAAIHSYAKRLAIGGEVIRREAKLQHEGETLTLITYELTEKGAAIMQPNNHLNL